MTWRLHRRTIGRAALIVCAALVPAIAAQAQQGVGISAIEGPKVVPAQQDADLSTLPQVPANAVPNSRPWRRPVLRPPLGSRSDGSPPAAVPSAPSGGPRTQVPPAGVSFAGMSFNGDCGGPTCGGGWPPDPNHDVGPNHIVQAVNVGYAIFNKTGTRLAAITENTLWATSGANQCNGHSQGDPIVVYDRLADRWILTHFAFGDSGPPFFDPVSPFFQCIAVSKTGDPVAGGWWLYAVRMDPGGAGAPPVGALNDYGKFGMWHDCLYMGANEFDSTDPQFGYLGSLFASFSRADMYSGAPLTFAIGFISNGPFTLLPAHNLAMPPNAPAPGTPEYFASDFFHSFEIRKFTAGRNCGAGGTMGAPVDIAAHLGAYTFLQGNVVPQPNTGITLDMIDDRPMQKVIYRKVNGVESLWAAHTVGLSGTGPTAMQWMQIDVTGGTVNATPVQQGIHDASDSTLWRFMGSLAVDGQGNMLLGYTRSGTTSPNFPSIAVAGRLAGDPPNTLAQTERQVVAGGGSQTNDCGGPCDRWGDYSAMSVDPSDDCTFWYSNEYYANQTQGTAGNWQTQILSFKYPGCTSPLNGNARTFVSAASSANDGNPCTAGAPCRTLAHALTLTAPGGEIQILDSGGYGGLTIDRPVTIAASQGVFAGVSVSSGDGIIVDSGASGSVTLRGLTINSLGGTNGIVISSALAVNVENCTVSGFGVGIRALQSAGTTLTVRDSALRANTGSGIAAGPSASGFVQLSIEGVAFERNGQGISITQRGASGVVRDSVFSQNQSGAVIGPASGGVGSLEVRRSTFDGNTIAGFSVGNTGATARLAVSNSLFSNNGTGIQSQLGGAATVADTTITRNAVGVAALTGGTMVSFGNNRLLNNTSNGSFTSTTSLQ